MHRKATAFLIALLILFTGAAGIVAGQEGSQGSSEGSSDGSAQVQSAYRSEMETLALMVKTMIDFSSRVNSAENDEDIITACNRLAHNLELLGPKMRKLTEEHPDWDSNPPDEVREPMSRYIDAHNVFSQAVQQVAAYVRQNPDNSELQEAYGRVETQIARMNG
jgi:cytochrome c556